MASQKSSIVASPLSARPDTRARYDQDILSWADQQAALLRTGRFDLLDIAHIADEIEDVGKSEKRELASRMAILLAHLLKWQAQPAYRGKSWERTIRSQRLAIRLHLEAVPSLKPVLRDPLWLGMVWADAVSTAAQETGLDDFPEECPWPLTTQVLGEAWLPQV
jgi:hypothetical protein